MVSNRRTWWWQPLQRSQHLLKEGQTEQNKLNWRGNEESSGAVKTPAQGLSTTGQNTENCTYHRTLFWNKLWGQREDWKRTGWGKCLWRSGMSSFVDNSAFRDEHWLLLVWRLPASRKARRSWVCCLWQCSQGEGNPGTPGQAVLAERGKELWLHIRGQKVRNETWWLN